MIALLFLMSGLLLLIEFLLQYSKKRTINLAISSTTGILVFIIVEIIYSFPKYECVLIYIAILLLVLSLIIIFIRNRLT